MPRKKRAVYDVDEAEIAENVKKWPVDVRDYYYRFSITFNRLLIEQSIDQEKMSEETGISSGTISNYRNGIGNPSLDKIRIIAKYLNVDCNYLLTGIKAENQETADYTGLSEQAINQLHYYKEHSGKEKRGGWLSIESKILQALNTLIETDVTVLLYIADYLHFRRFTDFSMIPDPASYPDLQYEEFKDAGIDINGEYEFENQTVHTSMYFNVSDSSDLLLLKIQRHLSELREQIQKGGGRNAKEKQKGKW